MIGLSWVVAARICVSTADLQRVAGSQSHADGNRDSDSHRHGDANGRHLL